MTDRGPLRPGSRRGQAPSLAVDLAPGRPIGLRLRHPVIVAAGGAGYGSEMLESVGDLTPGAIVTRGSHTHRSAGQPAPAHGGPRGRAAELDAPPGSGLGCGRAPARPSLGELRRAHHRQHPRRQRRGHRLAGAPPRRAARRGGPGARPQRPGPRSGRAAHRPRCRERASSPRSPHGRPRSCPSSSSSPRSRRTCGRSPRRWRRPEPTPSAPSARCPRWRSTPAAIALPWDRHTAGSPARPSRRWRCGSSTRSPRSCASPSSASAASAASTTSSTSSLRGPPRSVSPPQPWPTRSCPDGSPLELAAWCEREGVGDVGALRGTALPRRRDRGSLRSG